MNDIAVGKQGIRDAALHRFAQDGYEGASLRDIAEAAGIKKPSIYAHYQGKDDLFLQVLDGVLHKVRRRIRRHFILTKQLLEMRLYGLLTFLQDQYRDDEDTKFLLRTAYFPPQALYDEVMNRIYPFLDEMEHSLTVLLRRELTEAKSIQVTAEQAAVAFMTLVDGVLVDMLYEQPERSRRRLELVWPVYWRGLGQDSNLRKENLNS